MKTKHTPAGFKIQVRYLHANPSAGKHLEVAYLEVYYRYTGPENVCIGDTRIINTDMTDNEIAAVLQPGVLNDSDFLTAVNEAIDDECLRIDCTPAGWND